MHAALLHRPGRLESREVEEPPPPAAGEALVAVRRVGICGTDFHAYSGTQSFFDYPRVLGHELAVEVLALGPDTPTSNGRVTTGRQPPHLEIGDFCAVMPYLSCGLCRPCRSGRSNCCEQIEVLGVTVDGGMCERMVVPVSALYCQPELSLDQLSLVETLGIGMHAVERAQPQPTDSVLILGMGPIGLAVAQCLAGRVASVVAADLAASRVAFAAQTLDVEAVVAGPDLGEWLRERQNGDLPTLVFDATGSKQSMEASFALTGHGGRLVLVGHTTGPLTFENPLFHSRELDVRASRNALASEWSTVLDQVASGGLDALGWISHRPTLHSVSTDLPDLIADGALLIKAVVDLDARPTS